MRPSAWRWRPGAGEAGAALSGLLAAQAFPSLDLGVLAWIALIPLLAVLSRVPPARGAWLGFVHGVAFFGLLLPWIPGVVSGYGGLAWPVGVAVGALLVAILALFHALFGAVQAALFRRLGDGALLAAPAAWVVLAEWLRLFPVGGFPWGYLGYTQHRSPGLLQLAPWGGVFGLTLLVVAVNAAACAALTSLASSRPRPGRLAWGALALALPLGGAVLGRAALPLPVPDAPALPVAIVQGNVPQDQKWQVDNRQEILDRHLRLTEQAAAGGARLILWPESSTLEEIETSPALRDSLAAIARRHRASLVVGSIHREGEGRYTNAAFLMGPDGELAGRYDKIRLVPFGETVPLRRLLFFVGPLVEAAGDFTPGTRPGVLGRGIPPGEGVPAPFGVAICYEVTYPDLVAAQVREGASFLTTLTNDAWFGRSAAPTQHFVMAVMRAAESRRWLLRAANTGISGVVGPDGSVHQTTPLFETALVEARVVPRQDLTFAVRNPQAVPGACVMILALAALMAAAAPWNRTSANSTMS